MQVRICNKCKSELSVEKLDNDICINCGYYLRIHARRRIEMISDENKFVEWDKDIKLNNMSDLLYAKEHNMVAESCNLSEAIITGQTYIGGKKIAIGVMDTRFMMASMGWVVGEKVTCLFEKATKKKLPVILFCCSGGARLQEDIISLMQMEKTSQAVKKHHDAKLLYISVLTNPTMGGVTASFALNADIILAEKGAMIGFAGKRVIEQNVYTQFTDDFQTAEIQKKNGCIDAIVERDKLRDTLVNIVRCYTRKYNFAAKKSKKANGNSCTECNNTSWEKVLIARSVNRPSCREFIHKIFSGFIEFSGDRVNGEDCEIIAGIAEIQNIPVAIIGQQREKGSIEKAKYYNWGMTSPAGYRKALRIMKQAEKFRRPIVCFIDTIGADCTQQAEEEGQAMAIAQLLKEASSIHVPILSIIIGEGNSGGALALGVGNEVWMLENAVYSILSPEGYASILWKDSSRKKEAANMMRMTAQQLYNIGIIDKIIFEEEPVTIDNMNYLCEVLKDEIVNFILKYRKMSKKKIILDRYNRFRKY